MLKLTRRNAVACFAAAVAAPAFVTVPGEEDTELLAANQPYRDGITGRLEAFRTMNLMRPWMQRRSRWRR